MKKARVLVVDDEPKIAQVVGAYLEADGFEVTLAHDGVSALRIFELESPDLVVLDLMLPGLDGKEFCRRVRQGRAGGSGSVWTPIIMLTARTEEADRLIGLELGADDYVTKPFSPRELVARVKAVLKRTRPETRSTSDSSPETIAHGPLKIHTRKHIVELDGTEVALTATEFEMLHLMAANPRQVFSRRELIEVAQGEYYEGYGRTVDTHIKNLRKKLKGRASGAEFIETVHGVGYRFKAEKEA